MPIAPGSLTQLPPNSTGPKLATGPTYTENANVVQDEKVILGENYLASYMVGGVGVSTATASAHLLQIMAGASLRVRIRRIELYQASVATAVTLGGLQIFRVTTAGTGGGVVTPQALDPADGASGATAMTLPTVKGTEGAVALWSGTVDWMQTLAASNQFYQPVVVIDFDRLRSKPLIIAAGVTNGIVIKNATAVAASTTHVNVWFDEIAWA